MDNKKMVYVSIATIFVVFALALFTTGAGAEEEYTFVTMWPELPQPWYFSQPQGIAVDSSGNVYVVDTWNNRIQKFDSSGNFITKWGSFGTGDGKFDLPLGIAVDSGGNVYVADTGNYRIQKFDSSGNFITKWGSSGNGEGKFGAPEGIAVDSSGNVFLADSSNDRIQKFDSYGNFITTWGSSGTADGEFQSLGGIAVDGSGNVYVVDLLNDRIQKFNSDGDFITKWGSRGEGDGEFEVPRDIAVDSSGNVYVVDALNNRIQKFDSEGNFITKWWSRGEGDGEFYWPCAIAVDSSGNVYVADTRNHRIQKFELYGAGGTGEIAAQITAGADDGFAARTPEYFSADSKAITIGTDLKFTAFLRFPDLKIPSNATITKAYISVVPAVTNPAGPMVHISAADAADPAAPTTSSDFYARKRTASSDNWYASSWNAGKSENSTDISSVIQELVDSYDYSVGAHIMIFLDIAEEGSENQYFAAFEDAEYEAPKLYVEYSTGESTDTKAPIISNIAVNPTYAEPGTPINISAKVVDDLSGVRDVKCIVSKDGEDVSTVFMLNRDNDGIYIGTWHTTI
ncbi:Streptogramin lyase, partial [Methanophagales archaeon]